MARGQKHGDRRSKKRKEREKRIRRERNLRRNQALPPIDDLPSDELEDEEEEDLAPPVSPFETERRLREMAGATPEQAFASPEAFRRFLEALEDDRPEALSDAADGDPRELAQRLAYLSMETDLRAEAEAFAESAVALDPGCCDALAVLATLRRSAKERIEGLAEALRAGERALGGPAFLEAHAGDFWGIVTTRPYMRTRQALADELRAAGRLEEAASHYAEMLRLNPDDNQGVRHCLLGIRLEQGDAAAAAEVLDRYEDDALASAFWGRVLERVLAGDLRGASRALRRARRRNRHVERELLSPRPVHSLAQTYALGSKAEAAAVRHDLGRAWRGNRRALDWLAEGGVSTTAAERRAAVASYAEPVASLLGRVEPSGPFTTRTWRDAPPAEFGPADVPELIRMATDRALHESTADVSWAPVHAWRALAALGAGEAVEPLVDLARDLHDESWVADELPLVLGALAPASLAPLAALLAEGGAENEARAIAAEALGCAVVVEPTNRGAVGEILLAELRRFRENPRDVNAFVIGALVEVDPGAARGAMGLIGEAYEERRVNEDIAGSLREVRRSLR